MLANTKQVRAIVRLISNSFFAQTYTDKTIKRDKTHKRRSVVFLFNDLQEAYKTQEQLQKVISNKVTITGVTRRQTGGYERKYMVAYLRIIADIA
jgi:hypothetical protein